MSRNLQTGRVVNETLKILVVASMTGTVLIAPNLAQPLDKILKYLDKRSRKSEAKRIMYYMKQKRLVDYKELPDGTIELWITEKGKRRMNQINFDEMTIKQPRHWDKKWRLVMFDIPEHKRKARSALSMKLKSMGFYQLQKSAWLHPYPCNSEIDLIKQVYEIPRRCVIVAEIGYIDDELQLLKHFKFV
jgi:DNA-binding transcriptional regulator PaaX